MMTDLRGSSIFSNEYMIEDTTGSLKKEALPVIQDKKVTPPIEVEAKTYGIGKPKRKLILARIDNG